VEFDFVKVTTAQQLDMYIDDILKLQHACDVSLPEDSWYIASDKEDFYEHIEKQNGAIILALVDFRVAGMIASGYDEEHYRQAKAGGAHMPGGKYLYLCSACVDFPYRGNGLQYRLMMELIAYAKANHYKGCWCRVHPDNVFSVRNIEKAGLKHISNYTTDIGWPRSIYALKFGLF
jgi:ribosomal protein S18 acetylase RimI-like enzyme